MATDAQRQEEKNYIFLVECIVDLVEDNFVAAIAANK